jgi:hypothetical protein
LKSERQLRESGCTLSLTNTGQEEQDAPVAHGLAPHDLSDETRAQPAVSKVPDSNARETCFIFFSFIRI